MGSMYLILGVCHRGHRMLYKQLWVSVKGMNPNYASIQLQHRSAMRDCPRTPSFTLQQFHTVPGMMQAGIQWSVCTVMSDCFSRASNALSFVPVYKISNVGAQMALLFVIYIAACAMLWCTNKHIHTHSILFDWDFFSHVVAVLSHSAAILFFVLVGIHASSVSAFDCRNDRLHNTPHIFPLVPLLL